MVDIVKVASQMEAHGFKNIGLSTMHGDRTYELEAERKSRRVLLRRMGRLDDRAVSEISQEISALSKEMGGLFSLKTIVLCVLTDGVDPGTLGSLMDEKRQKAFKPDLFVFHSGKSDLLVVDLSTKEILPFDEKMKSFHASAAGIERGDGPPIDKETGDALMRLPEEKRREVLARRAIDLEKMRKQMVKTGAILAELEPVALDGLIGVLRSSM